MVASNGDRRRISRKTLRPPTPESKTPIGRGSDTASVSHRGVDRGATKKRQRHPSYIAAHGRVWARDDERHAFVVGLDDKAPVGHNLKVGPSAQSPGQLIVTDAAARVSPVDDELHLIRRVADGGEDLGDGDCVVNRRRVVCLSLIHISEPTRPY